jgi:hypothetical protein
VSYSEIKNRKNIKDFKDFKFAKKDSRLDWLEMSLLVKMGFSALSLKEVGIDVNRHFIYIN